MEDPPEGKRAFWVKGQRTCIPGEGTVAAKVRGRRELGMFAFTELKSEK